MPTVDILPGPMVLGGDSPRARRGDPVTSHQAADSNAGRVAVEVFVEALFTRLGGLTDWELTEAYFTYGGPPAHADSPRKRRSDLTRRGLLRASGLTRPTRSGRAAVVWVLAPAAVGS